MERAGVDSALPTAVKSRSRLIGRPYGGDVSASTEAFRTYRPAMASYPYVTRLHWAGSTGAGIRSYSRDHVAVAPPATPVVALSADSAFRGDPDRLNPEQLVVMAAASCQMLSFLGAAARAGTDVLAYDDEATSHLDLTASPARLATIRLAVTVKVAAGTDEAHVQKLAEQAHRDCYVASSLAVPVEVATTVVFG
jgi:organic hydroperoxide reductase OsmC/OhrA